MATCPKGHESQTLDYCDTCGALMGGVPAAPAPAAEASPGPEAVPAPAAAPCPVCGTAKTGRFCEEDGYDFLLAPPVTAPPTPTPTATPDPAPAPGPAPAPPAGGWRVVVRADAAYFEVIRAMAGEDAGTLVFPRFVAERRFELAGDQVVVGRRSRSRGVNPDIDLVGPPEDPGVSHLHALLVPHEGGWAVVDLDSANGTYVGDPRSTAIEPNVPVPLTDGVVVYLGAWTALVIQAR